MNASKALQHSWIKMLERVGERVGSPWLMAKLNISQLKSFIARRKWHVSQHVVVMWQTCEGGPETAPS